MKKSMCIVIVAALLAGLQGVCANDAGRPEKPNVVLLLADDLGWQDVKCYDIAEPSPMETPNMDALAKKGCSFGRPIRRHLCVLRRVLRS